MSYLKWSEKEIEIIGCSRTDAGVHALNQVANFQSDEKLVEHKVKKIFKSIFT